METIKELNSLKLLIKKTIDDTNYQKVMLAGLEAILVSMSDDVNIDQVKNQLYKYLDNPNPNLNDYIEISKTLEQINSPIPSDKLEYIIAGIDSFNNSKELLAMLEDEKLDFLVFFKVFAKFMSDAAEASTDLEGESPYSQFTEDNNISDNKKVSRRYNFFAKLLKILAHIILINAYIIKAIANGSTVLNNNLQSLYKNTLKSLKNIERISSKSIYRIGKALNVMPSKTNELFNSSYNQLLENYKQLQVLYKNLEHQVKVTTITHILNHDHKFFEPLFDPNNRDIFVKIAQNTPCNKQDQFTGLTGILNTQSNLHPIRNAIKDISPIINDILVMAIFTKVAIMRYKEVEIERQRSRDLAMSY